MAASFKNPNDFSDVVLAVFRNFYNKPSEFGEKELGVRLDAHNIRVHCDLVEKSEYAFTRPFDQI
jgi:hypothetical protein